MIAFAGRSSAIAITFVDALSYSILLPLLPFIVIAKGGGAVTNGWLVGVHALMAALSGPALGALSDRLGRRSVILVAVACLAGSYLLLAFASSLLLLFAARALAGAMAGNAAVVQALAADATAREDRVSVMGALAASAATGFVLGPALTAGIAASGGGNVQRSVCIAAAVVTGGAWLVALRLPEDAPPPGEASARSFDTGGTALLVLLGVLLLLAAVQTGMTTQTAFWTARAGWRPSDVAGLFTAVAGAIVLAQLTLVPLLARAMGRKASLGLWVALALVTASSLAALGPHAALTPVVVGLLFVALAAGQAVGQAEASVQTADGSQGRALGLANAAMGLGRVLGPIGLGYAFVGIV